MWKGLLMVLVVCGFHAHAQEVKLRSGFIEDSVGIGEPVRYWLSASYPANLEVVLPDSLYAFDPYEFLSRDFQPTIAVEQQAYDRVVYTLQSFEIDLVQKLSLEVLMLTGTDTLKLASGMDSIYFRELVPMVTDSTQLKTNLAFRDVAGSFNQPLFLLILTGIFIIMLIVLLIFGKKIVRNLKLKKLRKDYEQFSYHIGLHIQKLKQDPEPTTAEVALAEWKKYLEKLEKVPYTKYTTKEILAFDNNSELKDTLKVIDRTVYGKIPQPEIFKSFQDIEDFTQHRYSMVLDQMKNGY